MKRFTQILLLLIVALPFSSCMRGLFESAETSHKKAYKKIIAKYQQDIRLLGFDSLVAVDSLNFSLKYRANYRTFKEKATVKVLAREGKTFWLSFNGEGKSYIAKVKKHSPLQSFTAAVEEVKIWETSNSINNLSDYERLTPLERYGYTADLRTWLHNRYAMVNPITAFYHAALVIVNGSPQGLKYWHPQTIALWWGDYADVRTLVIAYREKPEPQDYFRNER